MTATAVSLRRLLSDGIVTHVYREWLLPKYNEVSEEPLLGPDPEPQSLSVVLLVNFIMGMAIHDDQHVSCHPICHLMSNALRAATRGGGGFEWDRVSDSH